MKTAHKINNEGKKRDQLKSAHAQTKSRPLKTKSIATKQKQTKQTSKGEKVKYKCINK